MVVNREKEGRDAINSIFFLLIILEIVILLKSNREIELEQIRRLAP